MYARKTTVVIFILAVIGFAAATLKLPKEYKKDIFDALDTYSSITVVASGNSEEILSKCEKIIYDCDKQFSKYNEKSEIFKMNSTSGVQEISQEIYDILCKSEKYYIDTQKRFDPTVGAISDLWAEAIKKEQIPEKGLIAEKNSFTGFDKLNLTSKETFQKPDGCEITLGAVAKGVISDKLAELLKDSSSHGALISLGGNVYAYGRKKDNSPWKIGLQDPYNSSKIIGTVTVDDKFVITSGDYERFADIDGKRYHHIIDAVTGYPADNELCAVTIVSDDGFSGDALSTACFLSGLEDGKALAKKYNVLSIFVTKDKKIYYDKELEDILSITAEGYVVNTF